MNPQIMLKYQQLIKENLSEIAKLITVEQVVKKMSRILTPAKRKKSPTFVREYKIVKSSHEAPL